MKIHGDMLSPFVRMCMVTAHEAGLGDKVEHVKESVSPTAENPRLALLSPIAKVPVLETNHGHPIFDSRVIMEYLCHVAGNSALIPDDGVHRFKVLTLLALAQGLADSAVATRYELGARPKGLQWPEWLERTRIRMTAIFDSLERDWSPILGEVTVGTIASAVVLSYISFRLPDVDWKTGRPKLAAFHAEFSKRESMLKTPIGV
ncbi:glutathione S-transferase family protein [Aestuariivirga sp.]|uniref:glutathione S-transferase family protein n=1 Tax=Aestuariivirga sp. TaxID=2650926 RepID=UPI0039E3CC7F